MAPDLEIVGPTLSARIGCADEAGRQEEGAHTVRTHTSGTKRLNHPVVGELTIGYDVLAIQSTPGLSITTYLPEPGTPSADALDMLRSWVADRQPAAHMS